ncbi:MAG TPA: cyanophycin synthetase, partial [Deinococcales bacterium]|nr:cyanophycin synthetase [Deinococcales bacterium]
AEELGATFFEVVVLCAWLLFRDAGCDTAVFEVGLGGRFDATNTADPRVSVITGVDLDHTAVLGNSVAEIAADKACIGRSGRPLFTAARGEALAVIREHAGKHGTDVRAAGTDFQAELLGSDWSGNRIRVREGSWELEFDVALPGPYQLDNAALAALAARELGADDTALTEGAAAVRWPGRFETVRAADRSWLLDGAHNPAGARALKAALAELGARPAVLIAGLTADKDAAGIARELAGVAPFIIATRSLLSPRALEPEETARLFEEAGVAAAATAPDPDRALQLAREASKPAELVVAAGSLYLLGELRPLFSGGRAGPYGRWQ